MREPLRDKERLEHMLAAIDRVIRYTSGKTFEDLTADDMMYYAVVKNIEIIGEAANLLSADFVALHPETPWKQVKGMRNYIVHEYFQIDDVVVWGVVTGHQHNHVGLTENFDQSENEEFLVNDSP